MKATTKRKIRKLIAPIRRLGLKNRDFSIISNNCWGGYIYDIFGLQYQTPTIGLFFISEDYIKFISNLHYYLSLEATPITKEESKWNGKVKTSEMIGKLGDIELMFVHYNSTEDGCTKWNYRKTRVNYDNLLVKFNDQNEFKIEHLDDFNKSSYENKVFFTAKKENCMNNYSYCFQEYKNEPFLPDDIKSSMKYIRIKQILNSIK